MGNSHLRRHLPALGLVMLVALIVRLAWIAAIHPDPLDGRFDDTAVYRLSAHYLSIGDGYVNPFVGTPTANWPPGYPAFLAVVFKLFGEGISQTYVASAVLAALTVAVVYAIGGLLFDRRTALLGAGALAVWPGQVYFTSLTLSEILFTLLFTTGVLLMLLLPRAGTWRGAALLAFGAVTGVAVLTRGQALVLLPLAAVVWSSPGVRWRTAIARTMLAAAVVAVVLAPWVVRNQRELGSPVIIATNFGANLWFGHHEGATGRMVPDEPPLPERVGLTQGEYEVKASNLALRKGLGYMVTHPLEEVLLSGTKIRAMYESDATALDWDTAFGRDGSFTDGEDSILRRLANGYWFALLGLAAVGLIAVRAQIRREIGLLPALVALWTFCHLLFFGDPRFHYPIVFAFALLGARGAIVLYEAAAHPQLSLSGRYARA